MRHRLARGIVALSLFLSLLTSGATATAQATPPTQVPVTPTSTRGTAVAQPKQPLLGTSGRIPTLALAIGGAGIVTAGVGIYLALWAETHKDRRRGHCLDEETGADGASTANFDNRCDTIGLSESRLARRDEIASYSFIGAGVAAMLVGELLFLRRNLVRPKPLALLKGGGLALEMQW